jgi:hypothetical protein
MRHPNHFSCRCGIWIALAACLAGWPTWVMAVDYYQQDFESGLGGFVIDNTSGSGHGLWHRTDQCLATAPGHGGSGALYYGDDTSCTYAVEDPPGTPVANQGTATSPAIDLTAAAGAVILEFQYVLHTQDSAEVDTALIEISTDDSSYQVLRTQRGGLIDPTGVWRKGVADLTPWKGRTITLRFGFNTVNSGNNNYPGFAIDDIRVHDGLEPVSFEDSNLLDAVKTALGISDPPTKADMLALPPPESPSLSAWDANVVSLAGLEYAVNLMAMDLSGNAVSDVSPLAGLTKLYNLSLGTNQITDISALDGLNELDALSLCKNQISDITPLSHMPLSWLDFSDNQVSDIALLAGLKNTLGSLSMNGNPLNTPAYCRWIPFLEDDNPELVISYDSNPNVLTADCSMDIVELAAWIDSWLDDGCSTADDWCAHADLDHNGRVDAADFAIIADLWLQ